MTKPGRMKPKSPWFDAECIQSKRKLNTLAKKYGRSPHALDIRDSYYNQKRSYRKLIKSKRENFIEKLCKDIEDGKNIDWDAFKALKKQNSKTISLNAFDMVDFCQFFQDLYGKI